MFFGKRKRAEELRAVLDSLSQKAESSAGAGKLVEAAGEYAHAWTLLADTKGGITLVGEEYAFWLLMNCVNAEWLAGNCEGALEAADVALRNLSGSSFGPVGNPFFHLRVGECFWTLNETERQDPTTPAIDNLARALIGGGIEMYSREPRHFLDAVTVVLRPPEEFETWEASRGRYAGACTHLLAGAMGPVRAVLTEKFGRPPPYAVT